MGNSDSVNGGCFKYTMSGAAEPRNVTIAVHIWLIERHIQSALLSIEDANMTAFFFSSPLWSRGPARYLMEKYWIWCVVETVHNPVKSFREDFSKGVWVLTQQHCLPFLSLCLCDPHKHGQVIYVIWSSFAAYCTTSNFCLFVLHVGFYIGEQMSYFANITQK